MKTVRDLLRDTDPLCHEPDRPAEERDRLRQAIATAASDATAPLSTWFRARIALLAAVAMAVIAMVAVGCSYGRREASRCRRRFDSKSGWRKRSRRRSREAGVSGSDRLIYLHQDVIVTNSDIAQCRRPGDNAHDSASRWSSMRRGRNGCARPPNHVGKPAAILIDGEVVAAPVVRGPVSTLGLISGDYTRADAERIVNGIGIR